MDNLDDMNTHTFKTASRHKEETSVYIFVLKIVTLAYQHAKQLETCISLIEKILI